MTLAPEQPTIGEPVVAAVRSAPEPSPRWAEMSETERRRAVARLAAQMAPSGVARVLGTTAVEVRRVAAAVESGRDSVARTWTEDEVATVLELIADGESYAAIGRRLGRSTGSVHSKAFQRGLSARQARSRPPMAASHAGPALLAAPPRGCLWGIGETVDPAFHFCGAPRQAGRSYCADHHRLSWRPRGTGEGGA